MSLNRSLKTLIAGLTLVATAAFAGTNPKITVHPTARITEKLDVTKRVTLDKTHPASIGRYTDLGQADTAKVLSHVQLVLKISNDQQYALTSLLDAQQDKGSSNYHQWLTPDTYGKAFGVDPVDIETVKAWLQSSGIKIESVSKSARIIDFTGTVGQIQNAFGTSMHSFSINGDVRLANVTDISIPAAIAPVFKGVALSEAKLKPLMVHPHNVKFDVGPGKPAFTGGDGEHYVGASDFATIYNTNSLLNAGNNGSGVNVALLGETDILLSDIQTYRRLFNLPQNDPTFVSVGPDVGTAPGDDGESDLDVEVSGGAAPGAHIDFVTGGETYFGGGIFSAAEYVVENNSDDIISLSYGECEYVLNEYGENAFINVVWEQAAAQGQSVFVSTGDELVAGCDGSGDEYAYDGYAVNGMASTPFNVAVGGTMFNDTTTLGPTKFWSGTNNTTYSTALSYIPEMPWNEGAFDPYGGYDPNTNPTGGFGPFGEGIVGGSSGISAYYLQPAWQTGPGVPTVDPTLAAGSFPYSKPVQAGVHRYLPDVSLNAAADHDGTIFCSEGDCVLDDQGNVYSAGITGGTSVSAPSMAGLQALINQKLGGRQGNPNFHYYKAAAAQSTTLCDSDTFLTTATTACAFHDVQTGNTYTPTAYPYTSTKEIGFGTNPGYDLSVGLGSPDMSKLVAIWPTLAFNATTTAFTVTPLTSAHGVTYTVNIAVAPVSTSITTVPTGDVSIIAQALYGGVGFYTLSAGKIVNGTLTGLPGGTYNVYAHYAGDTVFAASSSPFVQVTVGTETPTVALSSNSVRNGTPSPATTFAYGAGVFFQGGVTPPSGNGVPTGTVIFNLKNGTTALTPYSTTLDPNGAYIPVTSNTLYNAGTSMYASATASSYLNPTYPLLSPGVYTATLAYNGDTTFNATTSSSITFTVGTGTPTVTLYATPADIAANASVTLTATVAGSTGAVIPQGVVTFTDTTVGAPVTALGSCTVDVTGACTVTTTAISKLGGNTVSAAFVPSTASATYYTTPVARTTTVNVTTGTAGTVTLTQSGPIQVLSAETLTATVPVSTANTTVTFYDSITGINKPLAAAVTVATSKTTATLTTVTLVAGTHNITAVWSGNSTVPGGTSTAQAVVVSKNTPSITLTGPSQVTTGNQVSLSAVFVPSPLNLNAAQTAYVAANPAPNQSITFFAGTTAIATVPLTYYSSDGTYIAQYTGPAPTLGTTVYTAAYPNTDPNYAGTNSNTNTTTVYTQGFTLSANPTSLTVPQGQAGLTTITATAAGKWSGTVTFTCTGAPLYATCAVGSPSVSFSGSTFLSTQSTAVSLITVAPQPLTGAFFWIPAVFLAGFLLVRRKQLSVAGRKLLTIAVMFCGVVALSGCGKSITRSGVQNGTPTGSYTITITAVGIGTNGSANITQSIGVNVMVVPPQ